MTLQTLLLIMMQKSRIKAATFRQNITRLARRRRDRRITRQALQHPSISAFSVIYGSGCDESLITLTGFDHQSFNYVLNIFKTKYDNFSPYSEDGYIRRISPRLRRRGRPRSMDACQCLALTLAWFRTRGSEMVLSILFGITGSVYSLFIRYGRRIILHILSQDDNAAVRLPSEAEIQQFKASFASRHSMLKDVYAVADGLKVYLEQSGDAIIQNMFYNGWTHDHYVGNVFVFAPTGVIIACALNAPGAMHNSTIAEWGSVYSKLRSIFDTTGGKCVVDSAFCKGFYPFLINSSQDVPVSDDFQDMLLIRQATSARQASEWGMRAFQGSFPRIKDRLVYEERGERRVIIHTLVLLFNLRTRLVGINQILETYMPHLSVEANEFLFNLNL